MKWFKNLLFVIFVFIIGIYIGSYLYNKKKETKEVFKINSKVYLLQFGVYSSIDKMKENGKSLQEYFYFNDEKGYHIIIGITLNKDLVNKIKNAYNVDEIYLKETEIGNNEFIENLKQYDNFISSLKDNNSIIEAEKQILSKYEEMVLKSE